ncbi:MAG TPA: V4R domain-containing protein [Gemmatimonadales bacterium]
MAAVAAIVPLSLLEAIRSLDAPVEDGLDELSPEIVSKRLGLSSTVAAQIARYRDLAEREGTLPRDEAVSVFRLVGRRQDAALVFADAGRRAARHAARRVATDALTRVSPNALGRRLAARAARRAARDVFGAELGFTGGLASASIADSPAVEAWPGGEACAYHAAALSELLRILTGFEGIMRQVRCRGRGDAACEWQAVPGGDYE